MPHTDTTPGIYKIVNKATGHCYVGHSNNVKKRVQEHFRLLRWNKHTNPNLQNAYNKYGMDNFDWGVEVYCEAPEDLDLIEEAFVSGEASFAEPKVYNISDFSKSPIGNKHSEETKARIRAGRQATKFDYTSEKYRKTLSEAHEKRLFSDPKFVAKVRFIVENDHMSYAERGRMIGADTSSTRRLALKYKHLKGKL